MQFPVSIELCRSRFLSLLSVLVHALSAGCLAVLPWSWPLRLLLTVLVGCSLWRVLQAQAIIGLCIHGRDRLDCLLAEGTRATLGILPDSTVFYGLIVLRLRIGEETRIRSLTLLPDQMSAEKFRALRLWLRWHAEVKKSAAGGV